MAINTLAIKQFFWVGDGLGGEVLASLRGACSAHGQAVLPLSAELRQACSSIAESAECACVSIYVGGGISITIAINIYSNIYVRCCLLPTSKGH